MKPYSFDDIPTIRNSLIERTTKTLTKIFPIEDDDFALVVSDLSPIQKQFTPQDENEAIKKGHSLIVPIRGTISLIDKKLGKPIATVEKRIIALPYVTSRGSIIINGVEYAPQNQLRLRPGIYVIRQSDNSIAARVHVAGALSHSLVLDPVTRELSLNFRQAKIPLLPVLEALGFNENEMRSILGKELFDHNFNQLAKKEAVWERLYSLIYPNQPIPQDKEKIPKLIQNAVFNLEVDPDVTKFTLKLPYQKVNKEAIATALSRIVNIARGQEDVDDRSHLAFTRVFGLEDLLEERLKESISKLKQVFNSVRARRSLDYFPPGLLDKFVDEVIFKSGLVINLTGVNPLEHIDTRYKVTRTGQGGLQEENIPFELRNLHPSHLGVIDPVLTPEGTGVGIDNRFSINALRDDKGNLYFRAKNVKSGKSETIPITDLFNKVITFPGELERGESYVRAIVGNQHVIVPRRMVDYVVPHAEALYSPLSNLVPMKHASYPQRVSMGARMIAQAVPLVEPDVPLVQSLNPESGKSYYEEYGYRVGALKSPVNGTVERVTKNFVVIRADNGEILRVPYYSHFPFNRLTFYTESPVVKAGDKVKKGDLILKSNYTDDKGTLALGKNLKAVYMALEGYNFEDAAIISESAAKKMASEHMYQEWHDLNPDIIVDKRRVVGLVPGKYSKEVLDKFNDDGTPKIGAVINKGEPILLKSQRNHVASGNVLRRFFSDVSPTWDSDESAIVVDVVRGPKHVNVILGSIQSLKVGDKIAGRWGDKHIIAAIFPDEYMPKDEKGEPFELVLNPLGVVGRVNTSQLWELLLSKLAQAKGQPITVSDRGDLYQLFKEELQRYQIKDKEPVIYERYGLKVELPTGFRYMHKLHHMAEEKLGERSFGAYTSEETPAKGEGGGAKRVGLLEMLGILGHGAYHVARDARVVRGQKNEDYWFRLQLGYDLPKIITKPFVYDKFLNQLIVTGMHPVEKGSEIKLIPLTNSEIKDLIQDRYLEKSETVRVIEDEMRPIEKGLFDTARTGGLTGKKWAGIKLAVPMPNPAIEDALRNLLGLTREQYLALLSGEKEIPGFGKGPKALRDYCASVNLKDMLKKEEERAENVTGEELDKSVRRIRFLKALISNNIQLDDLFWDAVPVLPPIFRPVGFGVGTDVPVISDLNYLYKNLMELNGVLSELRREGIDNPQDYLRLYQGLRALAGLDQPVHPKLRAQNIAGALRLIIGDRPKEGIVQRKLLGGTVDLVGRATIIPNPNLGIDEVSIPEKMAWEIYKPYIVRRLVKKGHERTQAVKKVINQDEDAKRALLEEMDVRPVIISRAPVLWKFGVMAAWPRLTKNNTIEIHPFLVSGFGADFDGDTMQVHVPADPEAVKEATEKMMPSKAVTGLTRFTAQHTPTMEYLGGLYYLSTLKGQGQPIRFPNVKALIEALKENRIKPWQNVIVG